MGFGREIFTDTSTYAIRLDAAEGHVRGLTLDEVRYPLSFSFWSTIQSISPSFRHISAPWSLPRPYPSTLTTSLAIPSTGRPGISPLPFNSSSFALHHSRFYVFSTAGEASSP